MRKLVGSEAIPWAEISAFEIGRYELLGCVLLVRCANGDRVPVFGVEGITGQPRRGTSVKAMAMAEELNARLRRSAT